jgi:hypothetical protein
MAEWEELTYDQLPGWLKEASKPPGNVETSYTKFFTGKQYRYQVRYDIWHGELQTYYWMKPINNGTPVNSVNSVNRKTDWVHYTNVAAHFSINRPSDWLVKTRKESELSTGLRSRNVNEPELVTPMGERVYIYSPSRKGHIIILGAVTKPGESIINDPEFYRGVVNGLETSSFYSRDGSVQVKSVSTKEDDKPYMINGNPARHVCIYTQLNGETLCGDAYIIAHKNAYYCLWYVVTEGSVQSDAVTASEIMKTFKSDL